MASAAAAAFRAPPPPGGRTEPSAASGADDVDALFGFGPRRRRRRTDPRDARRETSVRPPDPTARRNGPSGAAARRSFLSLVGVLAVAGGPFPPSSRPSAAVLPSGLPWQSSAAAHAAETIGKDPTCNSPSCLGVWDGLLADCPHGNGKSILGGGPGCASSQDDTPGVFAEPWDYSESVPLGGSTSEAGEEYKGQMDRLILALTAASKKAGEDVEIVFQEGRYLRCLFADGPSGDKSIGEFYFTPNDTTVQFRIGPSAPASSSSSSLLGRSPSNLERAERIRKSLGYLKVPVLRNRKRTFFFAESDALDGFGPGSASLGPPEEMAPGEIGGRTTGRTARGSDDADPRMRIDWSEGPPFRGVR